jgi:hypothetical protein
MWILLTYADIGTMGLKAPTAEKAEPVTPKGIRVKAPRILGGGPDGFGYTYLSTQDGDPVPFNYIDISTTGINVGAGDDWCSGSSAGTLYYLGFSFPFYDKTTDSISICSNGTVIFNNKRTYLGLSNWSLPDNWYGEHGFVAVMWDDLDPSVSGAGVYFQRFTTCPDGYSGSCAVVQWYNVPLYGRTLRMDFQVIIYDNGNIKLQYNSNIDYVDATIGIQDSTAAAGSNPTWYLQYVYNGSPPGHVPTNGTAILFQYPTGADYDIRVLNVSPSGLVSTSPLTVQAVVRNTGSVPTSGTPVHLYIYDTVSNTLVFSDVQNVSIPASSNVTVTFSAFTPSPRSFYKAVVIANEPSDPNRSNDTMVSRFRTYYLFGDIVGSWTFPTIGDGTGYSFAGITYASDSGRFYVVSMNPMGRVFSFNPSNPAATFTLTPWIPHRFFGANDIPWGIAYVGGKFWISHVGYNASLGFIGNKMGIYNGAGVLIDSFNIWTNVESGYWMAGLDHDPIENVVYGVYVGGSNLIYKINPNTYTVVGTFPNHTGVSLRGIFSLPYVNEIYYGGWNQEKIYKLRKSPVSVLDSVFIGDMADADFWPCSSPDPNTPVTAFITLNNSSNTLIRMALGYYCDQLMISEGERLVKEYNLKVSGRTITLSGKAEVYDITGRKVAEFKDKYTLPKAGIYFVKVGEKTAKVIIR